MKDVSKSVFTPWFVRSALNQWMSLETWSLFLFVWFFFHTEKNQRKNVLSAYCLFLMDKQNI